jgi:conjugal transfer pilus assembly protein TraW
MKHYLFIALLIIPKLTGATEQWLQQSLDIIDQYKDKNPKKLIAKPSKEDIDLAKSITQTTYIKLEKSLNIPLDEESRSEQIIIFASFSMPENDFRAMLVHASEYQNIQIVIRGMKEGENISGTLKTIQQMLIGVDPQPNVNLNPKLFTEYNITVVPTMIGINDKNEIIRVSGSTAINWLHEKMDQDKTGDLGKYGTTYEIAEVDLIEVMKERAGKLDGRKIQERMTKQFWTNYKFTALTPAQKDKKLIYDPSITVQEDIFTPDGKVIARAGQKFNPLDSIPFTKKIVVFNATRKNEVDYVISLQRQSKKESHGLILMTTEVQRDTGWEHLQEVQSHFDYPVYMLNANIAKRFHIMHTPTVIHADTDHFIITEKYISAL